MTDATCFLRPGYRVFDPRTKEYGRVRAAGELSADVEIGGEALTVDQFSHRLLVVERWTWDNPKPAEHVHKPRGKSILCMDGQRRSWRKLADDQYRRLKSASACTAGN